MCDVIIVKIVLVREEAVLLIGNMSNISEEMLEQTLDKKLMSNMRIKKSAHERHANMVTSGEWSSGESCLLLKLVTFTDQMLGFNLPYLKKFGLWILLKL